MPILARMKIDAVKLLASVVEDYHSQLNEVEATIGLLSAWPKDTEETALKLHGYPCAAIIKIAPYVQRVLGVEDVVITVDGPNWERATEAERVALLDHELTHLELCVDENGAVKSDDAGRPKFRMRLHDFHVGGFVAVMDRHGLSAPETKLVRETVETYSQLRLALEPAEAAKE